MFAIAALTHGFDTFRAIVLGALQGFSELFPISSLGHTVLFPKLFGWNDLVKFQSRPESAWLAFIVMLHVGSAIGLLIYFWREWIALIKAFFATLVKRRIETSTERLVWLIIAASIPTGILGLALEHQARTATAKPEIAAIFLVVNGLILFGAERLRRRAEVRELARTEGLNAEGGRKLETLNYKEAAGVGVAQSAGLIAGISRDGMCMAAGLLRGLDNEDAAKFGFLLATPIILAAGIFKAGDLTGPLGDGIRGYAVIAAVSAAVVAVFTVHFLMRYFRRGNLNPFAAYCCVFGLAMIIYNA
ncbi:MAG TPA: undecaprenyl-diphosphate phosphatase [Solirubrobacteraceae bacterium]|nr:undecaprenyl-diphosphate phosphatase [Solirubrobacteraceae bacterium]